MKLSFKILALLVSVLAILNFSGCSSEVSKDKIATIKGRVIYYDTEGAPHAIDSVIVKAESYYLQTYTDEAGNFTMEIELEEKFMETTVNLTFYKTGFTSTGEAVRIKGGEVTDLEGQDIVMIPTGVANTSFAIINGYVFDSSNQPLENVTVTFSGAEAEPVFSGPDGSYSYSYALTDGRTEEIISATFERSGYERYIRTNIQIRANETTTIPNTVLTETSDTVSGAGEPYAIQIESIGSEHIYVTESGLPEITDINVFVTDVRGAIIDDLHSIVIHFDLGLNPGGGVTVYPDIVQTVGGRATSYLQAGTVAGPVQMNIWFEREDGYVAQVDPVQIAIWGGFPVDENFSVALEKVNIAGMRWTGLLDEVTAYLGDKYNNPVAPGTVVYFTSAYCYIEGSNNTDNLGRAAVQFVAAEKRPDPSVDPDSAIVRVYATTYGQPGHGETTVLEDLHYQTGIMLTGITDYIDIIRLSPSQTSYDDTTTVFNFEYHVSDVYGNPLVKDSRIYVQPAIGSVSGDIYVEMNDTQYRGDGATVFYFTWVAPDIDDVETWGKDEIITIKVVTPDDGNGNRNATVTIPYGG